MSAQPRASLVDRYLEWAVESDRRAYGTCIVLGLICLSIATAEVVCLLRWVNG